MIKGSAPVKGRLVSKIEASPSALHGRWLVSFDGKEYADEELFESSFDHAVSSSSDNEPLNTQQAPKTAVARKARKGNGRRNKSESESEPKNKKGLTSRHYEAAVNASDSSAHNNISSARTREARTARRQNRHQGAKVENPKKNPASTSSSDPPTGGNGVRGNKRVNAQPPSRNSPKRFKVVNNSSEEVVKVPMLTGTLYLYKGIKRRAEFVRKY